MLNEMFTTVILSINVFLLIFSRMLGLFLAAPVFGRNSIPAPVKIGFSILISYMLLPVLVFEFGADVSTTELLFLSIKELVIGLGLGFIAQLFFTIFIAAGSLIDMEIGLSMSQIYDPQMGSQVTITSRFMDTFAYLIFLLVDGHHYLLKSLVNSFYVLPIGTAKIINDGMLAFTEELFSFIFTSAVTIAIPITISIFLVNLLLAFMAKIMPQMNVFVVGMPLKIFIGLAVFIVSVPYIGELIKKLLMNMYEYIYLFTNVLKG